MKLLAIEATTPTASVAIFVNDQMIAHHIVRDGLTHSQNLLTLIDNALVSAKLKVSDLDGLIVANGPGSFTGLRIALATAKALAHPFNLPIYAVSTLRALSYHGRHFNGLVLCMLDARRDQVYGAVYNQKNEVILEEDTYALEFLAQQFQHEDILLVGDGAAAHRERLARDFGAHTVLADAFEAHSTAYGLYYAYQKGWYQTYTYQDLPAAYLRLAQAERELQQKQALSQLTDGNQGDQNK